MGSVGLLDDFLKKPAGRREKEFKPTIKIDVALGRAYQRAELSFTREQAENEYEDIILEAKEKLDIMLRRALGVE